MIDMKEYGYTGNLSETEVARITAVHRERYEIISVEGMGYARLKAGKFHSGDALYPTTGDFVNIQWNPQGDSLILAVCPRNSFFSRRSTDVALGEQAVAANFDYVFLVTSLNHDFNGARLERYLAIAWQSGALPVCILTKADLCPDVPEQIRSAGRFAHGVGIHAVSAQTGAGLEALNAYLQPGKTVVFLGSSGVGKSSLINAIAGEDRMRVNVTRDVDSSKGRHTTTYRQLIRLSNGAMVIDTPGMRELGLWDAEEGLTDVFDDVKALLGKCRFSDCRHGTEPDCAIRTAIEQGELDPTRWRNYEKLLREARYAAQREKLRGKQARGNGRGSMRAGKEPDE